VQHEAPTKVLTRCSEVLLKIEAALKMLYILKPEELSSENFPSSIERTEEVLDRVEKRLTELPLDQLAKCLKIISKVDLVIAAFETKPEETTTKEISLEKPLEEFIADIEQELSDVEKTLAPTDTGRTASMEKIKTPTAEEKAEFDGEVLSPRELADISKKLLTLKEKAKKTIESLEAKTKTSDVPRELSTLYKTVKREKQLTEARAKFVTTERTCYFEAWIPQAQIRGTAEEIRKVTESYCIVLDEPPNSEDKVPTVTKPSRSYINAFEKLTLAFGHPSATEINPAPIMVITFSLLFGIMFADVGQGALLALAGLAIIYFRKKASLARAGDITRYILVSGEMFVILGIAAMFFGFLFGEFFGPSEVIHPLSLGRIGPFYFGGFEPTVEPMKMLRLAILVGVIHLSSGLVLSILNEARRHHYRHLTVPICWLWLLLGGFFMWVYFGGISGISRWFSAGLPMAAGLVVSPLISLIVSVGIAEGFTEGFGMGVEIFAETLSHTISYSRVMALGLIHSAMSSLFLVLGGVEHGYFPLSSIPIVAIGTLLVMIIEGLVVFVHDLRLHWVEWFSKFYLGEGMIFKPFKFT
jgi:V/A-type H+-transporting ATPase subunit I